MACKLDIKAAILDKVMDELVEGRYTFTRLSEDTIQLNGKLDNNKTRVQSRAQAKAIANELVNRTKQSFYGHVGAIVVDDNNYDPITVSFRPSEAYINHEYDKLPEHLKTDSRSTPADLNRDYINSNTGPNTHSQLELFSPEQAEAGAFVKYIQFKRTQLYEYQRRLNKVEADKRKKNVTTAELNKLNKTERELRLQVEGSFELGIKGLKDEINELESNSKTNAVGYYVEKDLNRLDKLANSNDVDDIHEAQRLIDFYDIAGTFRRNVDNPFFSQEDIFLEDEDGNLTSSLRLEKEVIDQYKQWKDEAGAYQNIIDKRMEEVTVNTVNSDPSVKNTYKNKKFSFDELVNSSRGLKDTDWISMWTMDITQGIFSHNGIIPQVMFSQLANSFEKKLSWSRAIEEKIDHLTPKVQSELIKMGFTLRAGGIIGLKGASYDLFKEITKDGNETGGIVQRFVREFFDAQSQAQNKFSEAFKHSRTIDDYTQRARALNKAFEEFKKWRRANTIIVEPNKIPEIVSDKEFEGVVGNVTPSDEHKNYLVSILGEKGYKEQVENQKKQLRKYISDRQNMVETLATMEGKSEESELSDKAKNDLSYWETNNHPLKGVEDYNTVSGIFHGNNKANNFMNYNSFVPRKFTPNITVNDGKYQFSDTNNSTGHYSDAFKTIESNPVLSEFHDTLKEVCEQIRENLPFELQQKIAANTLPALMKSRAEIIADKNTGALQSLFHAFRRMMEKLRLGFGVTKQSEISYANVDPITGRMNYKVSDQFIKGNTRAISNRMFIEKTKFLQAYNSSLPMELRVDNIKRFSTILLNRMNPSSLKLLADYLHVDISMGDIQAGRIDKIRQRTGDNVEIGKYIRDFSVHSTVQAQSFDLAKIAKYYSNMTMMYAARQEALPILEIMKQHYEGIKKPLTNNLGSGIYNANDKDYMMKGVRTNAIKQMDDWFERVELGNYDTKHFGPHGNTISPKVVEKVNKRLAEIETQLATPGISQDTKDKLTAEKERLYIKKNTQRFGRTIYSDQEKKRIAEIESLLEKEKDPDKREKLIKMKEQMGKVRTATAIFDNLLGFIRTLRLGYNVSSATTNFLEGVTSNVILAGLNEYFDSKELFFGYHVIKQSFLKSASFGTIETPLAKKNRSFMDKFNVIMDSKNELQKSSVKTYADKFSWLNPHELNARVEYINQSPIMIAMLRTLKIKNKNGNESSVWNAHTKDGHLKEEFRTEENIKNWEELQGDEYLNFKQKLHKAIVLGHGNYDELRGMMIKSSTAGKALAMFKTWLPMQLYWRFATEQDDIQSNVQGFKGRYLSYGKGSAALHGAALGLASFGPLGAIAGWAGGLAYGHFFGTDPGVGLLKETIESTKLLALKMVGFPVNLIVGKQLINTGDKGFDKFVGKGDFTTQDAKNLRGNMADIAMQLAWVAMILMAKSMFWDDDDKPENTERKIHNILVNKLMQLSNQAAGYVNPVATYNSIVGSNGEIQYLGELGKEIGDLIKYFEGKDVIPSGPNKGQSALAVQTRKTFLPGLIKDHLGGFETQSQRQFSPSPFDDMFHGAEYIDKKQNQRNRAERGSELENQLTIDQFDGDTDDDKEKQKKKEIRKILDEEYPSPTKLHKLGVTREEYNQWLKEQQQGQQ